MRTPGPKRKLDKFFFKPGLVFLVLCRPQNPAALAKCIWQRKFGSAITHDTSDKFLGCLAGSLGRFREHQCVVAGID